MIAAHTLCTLLSYVAFLVAFIAGGLFLVQERQLKRKTLGVLFHRLPPLERLDRINFIAIAAGFVLLTLGLGFGFLGIHVWFGRWWIGDPKLTATVVLWICYLGLWALRVRATVRGHRVALWSMLGFTLVVFTGLAASWWLGSHHPYV